MMFSINFFERCPNLNRKDSLLGIFSINNMNIFVLLNSLFSFFICIIISFFSINIKRYYKWFSLFIFILMKFFLWNLTKIIIDIHIIFVRKISFFIIAIKRLLWNKIFLLLCFLKMEFLKTWSLWRQRRRATLIIIWRRTW